ncbi:MAG: hypothetical protein HYZ24_05550 [Chloroflexi bacterium]|nr:hypothetical protein [Chloroflexota bacterium]
MSNNLQRITIIVLILLAALLITQAAFSLQWHIAHDEAPLLYEAFLMQNGQIPYKDFFDFQMPGSYIAYYILGILSNFGPLRIRILDLIFLAAISTITYFAMRRFGKLPPSPRRSFSHSNISKAVPRSPCNANTSSSSSFPFPSGSA